MSEGPAERYHGTTSYERGGLPGGGLDWASQPDPWKRYPSLPVVELPGPGDRPGPSLAEVAGGLVGAEPAGLDREALGRLLHSAYGVTARSLRGDVSYRAAPSAGGLFPCELYAALPCLGGELEAGLYHYRSDLHGLTPLRQGDPTAGGRAVFFVTAVLFRSAWKYRRRAFRYHLLDSGHLAEGLVLAAAAEGLGLEVSPDFDDAAVSVLLGLDREREVPLALALPRGGPAWEPPREGALGPRPPAASPTSPREVAYDEIRAVVEASSAPSPPGEGQAVPWEVLGLEPGPWRPLGGGGEVPRLGLHEVARARRSGRAHGRPGPGDGARLDGLAGLLCEAAPLPAWRETVRVAVLAGDGLEGWEPGLWLLDRERRARALARPGELLAAMAAACLDQGWLAAAAAHVLLLADLPWLEARAGARGYRHALLEAGRVGQRAYLAATALGWSACGVGALYDREAATLLDLAPGSRLLYLLSVGPRRARGR